MDPVEALRALWQSPPPRDRPFVTLSYAQSLDGSLAAKSGERLFLSGPSSAALTHRLRAEHDGLLVGIETVLADDPELTVRLVPGPSPQPIVLDTSLRLPLTARLLDHPKPLWIATAAALPPGRVEEIVARRGRVLSLPPSADGEVELGALLTDLSRRGIQRLMVEGGPTVLGRFLGAHLADWAVLTIAPRFLDGVRLGPWGDLGAATQPRLASAEMQMYAADMVVWGKVEWPEPTSP